jgi:hypothetical protein
MEGGGALGMTPGPLPGVGGAPPCTPTGPLPGVGGAPPCSTLPGVGGAPDTPSGPLAGWGDGTGNRWFPVHKRVCQIEFYASVMNNNTKKLPLPFEQYGYKEDWCDPNT